MPWPAFMSAFAPERQCRYRFSSSTTSKLTWMPISPRLCWINSFIGSESIWPVPPWAMMTFALSGLSFE